MTRALSLVGLLALATGSLAQPMQYPPTRKSDHVDTYHGTKVADPYHWLEDDRSAETKDWVQTQNGVTFGYLDQIPYRRQIFNRLEQLYNYERFAVPYRLGKHLFFYKNDGLQNQSVLYRQEGAGQPAVFLDPNKLDAAGTTTATLLDWDDAGKTIAFSIQKAGSDWSDMVFYDAVTMQPLADTLKWVKFSGASFHNGGVYYSCYDAPSGSALSQRNENQKVKFHKFGTPQDQDELVYTDPKNPLLYFGADVSEDGRFLFINVSKGTSGDEVLVKDLSKNQTTFTKLCPGFSYDYSVIDNVGDRILVRTNNGAPNFRIVSIDPAKAEPKNWLTVLAETTSLLDGSVLIQNKLLVSYLKDVSSQVLVVDPIARTRKEVKLPGLGTATGITGKRKDKSVFFAFTSFVLPTTIYEMDLEGNLKVFKKPKFNFPLESYEVAQVFYPSKDGTKVPMFLVHKKGLEKDKQRPTLLYGYGGFNVNVQNTFSPAWLPLLEQGGVLAIANIRGGGEYGEKWHRAGMLLKKQNVFDDFIAAAQYLHAEGWTSPEHTAIQGGSNGGLLVGACMTQRPDLFKVAFPAVGVMDMLRYQKFTVGWGWAVEYGSSDSAKYVKYLKGYSPLHNLKPAKYPATLVTTADHDDRVVPAHSFKFISTLQENQRGDNPTLIRIETNAGHGAGKPIRKILEERADIYAFMLWNMGIKELKN